MKFLHTLLLALSMTLATACSAANDVTASEPAAAFTPMQAVEKAAELAPGGFSGVFEFKVRATGRDAKATYLNSEQDYRDQRNLTIALSPAAAANLEVHLGQSPRDALVGRTLRVSGVAHRVTIRMLDNGQPTDKYYYQTHVDVRSADQIEIVDGPTAPAPTGLVKPEVAMPPGFALDGRSAADLTTAWWQWAMSADGDNNPVADTKGDQCGVNQNGNVWFLAGGFGSSKIHRRCHVPADKYLFFPLVNTVYYPREANSAYSCDEAKVDAKYANESTLDLFAMVDGAAIPDLMSYRAGTKECFDIFARVPPTDGLYQAMPSATDGFWLMLKPLAKGVHILSFGGRQTSTRSGNNRMVQDIEYELVVD